MHALHSSRILPSHADDVSRRERRRAGLLHVVAQLGAFLMGTLFITGAAAATPAVDPERSGTAPTAWAWYHGVSAATLTNAIDTDGLRITDIEVESSSPYRFSATLVKNSGAYARTWWWYYDVTATQVTEYLAANNARLIDMEPYMVAERLYFAVVMVENTDAAAKVWWWYYNRSRAEIVDLLEANQARLIDIDSYNDGETKRYAVVMIANSDVDATAWWWYVKRTPAEISALLDTNQARLIDIEKAGADTFNVVMEKAGSEYRWWYHGKSADELARLASQNGARIVDLEPYFMGGTQVFAALMINNVNAETVRLREILRQGFDGGSYGISLKRVGGRVAVDLQRDAVFEPASSLKVLHHLHTMRLVQSGDENIDKADDFIWYHYVPTNNKDVCPDPADEVAANAETDTIRFGLRTMLRNSDNRTTRGFQLRYGNSALNDTAQDVGMVDTEVRQIFGCAFQDGLQNDTTLADLGTLYEGVVDGSLLAGADRTTFFDLLKGGPISPTGDLANLVRQEATALGKSAAVADAFIAGTSSRSKAGSYDACPPSGACSPPYRYIRTQAGVITFPFRTTGGVPAPRDYVYGRFGDVLLQCSFPKSGESKADYAARCPSWKSANDAMVLAATELFRKVVRDGLKTY